jgi:hypothetical protein
MRRILSTLPGMKRCPHEVHVAGHFLERRDRRRGVEHRARLDAKALDRLQRAVQVRQDFHMDGQHRGAGVGEGLEVAVRVLDHQMHVERTPRHALEGPDDRRANRDVGHEVSVHDVHVNQVGAAGFGGGDLPREVREVGGENRGRDPHAHRLTSMLMASPGWTW